MKSVIQNELTSIATNIANASVRLVDAQAEVEELAAYIREQKAAHGAFSKIQQAIQKEEKTDGAN